MPLLRLLIACILALVAHSSDAQSDLGVRSANQNLRPFAEPLYWLNIGSLDRLPIRERPLRPLLGFAGLAPPYPAREGLVPFASFALNYRDSSDPETRADTFAAAGLGASYRSLRQRSQIQADYFAEFTNASDAPAGVQDHGGSINLNYSLSPKDNVAFLFSHASTARLDRAPIQEQLTGATRFTSSSFVLGYGHDMSPKTRYRVSLAGSVQSTDQDSISGAQSLRLSGAASHRATPWARVDTGFGFTQFDLGEKSPSLWNWDLGATVDLGPTLAATGTVGILQTDADGGHTFGRLGGGLVMTRTNSRFEFGYERDVISVAGLSNPLLNDRINLQWDYRISRGLLAAVSFESGRLEQLSPTDEVTNVKALEAQLSYVLNDRLWLWGVLGETREENRGSNTRDQRLSVGFSFNLR